MKKTIKLTEQEFKNIVENSILKEQDNDPEVEKFYKQSDMKIWFLENVVDKVKQITKPGYPNYIFYVDKNTNETYMYYDQKNGYFWVDYNKIWSYFKANYSHSDMEIKQLIKDLVGEHYNLWDVRPLIAFFTQSFPVGEHYNF